MIFRSVYKELHADHETEAADNKYRLSIKHRESARYSACFVVWGFQRVPLWHTTLLAKCSVLYALSALLRKWGCRRGGQGHLKRQENRAVIAWHGAASAGLVSPADRAYMKAPVPWSHAGLRDKMSRTCGHTHEKADGFSSQN